MRTRAERRRSDRLRKRRTIEKVKTWDMGPRYGREPLADDPRFIGKQASVHCRGCGCWMCKYGSKKPEVGTEWEDWNES